MTRMYSRIVFFTSFLFFFFFQFGANMLTCVQLGFNWIHLSNTVINCAAEIGWLGIYRPSWFLFQFWFYCSFFNGQRHVLHWFHSNFSIFSVLVLFSQLQVGPFIKSLQWESVRFLVDSFCSYFSEVKEMFSFGPNNHFSTTSQVSVYSQQSNVLGSICYYLRWALMLSFGWKGDLWLRAF